MNAPGAFDHWFAARRARRRTVDEGLLRAVLGTIPAGKTIIDLGAGTGELVRALACEGRQAMGFDGTPGIEALTGGLVKQADLTDSMAGIPTADWVLSFEVGEHIPSGHAAAFLDNVSSTGLEGVMLSWAVIGQRGHGHVNCRSPEWVAAEMGYRNWVVDDQLTLAARQMAGGGWERKLLVLTRRFPCSGM